jgi:hypothetical protein
MLVDQARKINLWQAPLVFRSKLPSHVVSKLAKFVADDLLKKLQTRSDLDRATIATIPGVVHHCLREERLSNGPERSKPIFPNSAIFDFIKGEISEN